MEFINLGRLQKDLPLIRKDFKSKHPFSFTLIEDFFFPEPAELLHHAYPTIKNGQWDGTTYLDQKNKFQKTVFDAESIFDRVFSELNCSEFLKWLEDLTGIDQLSGDAELFGGGLHQSVNGAFLNVHVDYNIHPVTKEHRRINVLVYMNQDWKEEYEGHLELWDLTNDKKECIGRFAPSFNRCVIFETNEISFHGHPKPLNTPKEVNRKSIATYYYSKTRPENELAAEHNTIYVNTEGASGQVKRFSSGVKALLERINKK